MPALGQRDNCHKSTDYKRSTDNANMTRLNPLDPHRYITAAHLHLVVAQGSVKNNRVVRPGMLGNSLPVDGGELLRTPSIAFAYMWLRRFDHSAEPAVPSDFQLKRFDENIALRRVRQWPTRTDSWHWLPRQDKKTAAVTKQRARRKIWWRRRTPIEAYWELREQITGRWRPGATKRNPIPQVRGRKPPEAFVQLAPRPFSRRNLDAEFERLEGLVDHVGVIAADRQRQRRLLREQERRNLVLVHGSSPSRLFKASFLVPDRRAAEDDRSTAYPYGSYHAVVSSTRLDGGWFVAGWWEWTAEGAGRFVKNDNSTRLDAPVEAPRSSTSVRIWEAQPSNPSRKRGRVIALPSDQAARDQGLVAEGRERRPCNDLSDASMFWSSTRIEPKGCRQLVWKTGKPPEPIGKEFPPISTGSTHIRNVMRQINGVKKQTPEEERELVLRFYDSQSDIDCTKIVEANLRIASIHANRRAGFKDSYNNLLGASVLAMLKALRTGKFDPGQGTRLSTFFEHVVDSRIKDVLKKEGTYYHRHAFSDFRDNEDDHETDGGPIEKTDAVRLAVENKTAEEWIGEDNMVDQLEETAYHVDGLRDALDRWIINGRYYLNRSSRELGVELGISEDTVQRRQTRALAVLRMKLS
jgi:RNA polymerase sigma factor (sigma-70 family)